MTYYVVIAHNTREDIWYMPVYPVNKSISTDRNEAEREAKLWREYNKSTIYTVVEVTL